MKISGIKNRYDFRHNVEQNDFLKGEARTEQSKGTPRSWEDDDHWATYDWISSSSGNGDSGVLKRMPQVTVTYKLSEVYSLFKAGWLLYQDMMSGSGDSSFRTAVMQDSAAEADTLFGKFFSVLTGNDMDEVKSFLTLLVQDMKTISMRPYYGKSYDGRGVRKAGTTTYTSSSGTRFTKKIRYGKDCFGLLTKTPLPGVFRSLSPASKAAVGMQTISLKESLKKVVTDGRKRHGRNKKYADMGTFRIDDGDDEKIKTLNEYLGIIFLDTPYDEDARALAKNAWCSIIQDMTSTAIYHPKVKDNVVSQDLRVAFEYRQIGGGNIREAIRQITGLDLPEGKHELGCDQSTRNIQSKLHVLCGKTGNQHIKEEFRQWASQCVGSVTKAMRTDAGCHRGEWVSKSR